MNAELTITDVIQWYQADPQGSPYARLYGRHVGYITQSPTSRKDQYIYVRDSKRRRQQYALITQDAIDKGCVEVQQLNGRYIDIREVVGC